MVASSRPSRRRRGRSSLRGSWDPHRREHVAPASRSRPDPNAARRGRDRTVTTGGDDGPDMEPVRANQVPPQATRAHETRRSRRTNASPRPRRRSTRTRRASGRGEDFTRIRLRGDPPATPTHTAPVRPAPTPTAGGTARPCGIVTLGRERPSAPSRTAGRHRCDGRTTPRPLGARPAGPGIRAGGDADSAPVRSPSGATSISVRPPPPPTTVCCSTRPSTPCSKEKRRGPRGVSRVEGAHERNAASVVDAIERGAAATVLSDAPAVRLPRRHRRRPQQALVQAPRLGGDRRRRRTVARVAQLHSRRDPRSPDRAAGGQVRHPPPRQPARPRQDRPAVHAHHPGARPPHRGVRREPSLPWPVRLGRDRRGRRRRLQRVRELHPRPAGPVHGVAPRPQAAGHAHRQRDGKPGGAVPAAVDGAPPTDQRRASTCRSSRTRSCASSPWRPTPRRPRASHSVCDSTSTSGPITPAHQVSTGKPEDQRLPTSFTLAQLRDAFKVLEQLPPGHVERNNALDRLTRFRSADSRAANRARGTSAARTKPRSAPAATTRFFESSLRHEVGHGVDQKLGRAATAAPADKAAWVQWMDASRLPSTR